MSPRALAAERGFTLLESVVTLVIVSMLTAMLMQALGQSLDLRTRLLRVQGESRQMLLQEAWFRESVAGAQPPTPRERLDAFEADADGFSYVTAAPLVAHGIARVRWWLEDDESGHLSLYYSDPVAGTLVIVPGPLREAEFAYLGEGSDQWTGYWNSAGAGEGEAGLLPGEGVLPQVLRFQAMTMQGRRLYWLVHLPANLRASERIDRSEEPGSGI